MKLLVVGHPFILAYNQKKYVAIKQIDGGLELRIVGPKQIHHLFGTYRWERHPKLLPEEVIPLGSIFSGSHMTYVPDPVRLGRILQQFRPDVIHIEEEPHAAVTITTVALREVLSPQAALTLFTWDNLQRTRKFPLGRLKNRLRAYTLRHADSVVCGNRDAQRLLRERSHYAGHTEVLPQFGLDQAEHAPEHEPQLKEELGLTGSLVVGYLGRLVPEKGIELLLGALAQLEPLPWKLLLVGSGPLEQHIYEHWIPRFPGRIVHVRAVPHCQVPRYLRCLDVFVLASYALPNWKEQFGLTLAQAMMLGIPCVVSSSGALPEVGGSGALVFEERNQADLREKLRATLGSAGRRAEWGTRARAFALQHYTLLGVAQRYREVFAQAQRLHFAGVQAKRRPSLAAWNRTMSG